MSARATAAVAVATALSAVAVAVFTARHWGGIYDDTFIYLRYAKHVASGCGVRWNCDGPPVEGTTSLLYLAVLALGNLVTDQLIALCQIVDAIALSAALALAIVAARTLAPHVSPARGMPVALIAAVLLALAIDPFILLNAVTGMETALAAALVSAIAVAAIGGHPRALAALACTATLVRPEAMLFVLALPLLPWMRRWRLLAACAAFVLAVAAARYVEFGALAPNTYYAKSGGTWRHAALGFDYIVDCAGDFPLSFAAPLALLIAPIRRNVMYLLAVAAVWLAFFLRSGGDLFEYSRLWMPLVPALSALALAGIAELARRLAPTMAAAALAAPLACGIATGVRAKLAHDIPPQGTSERVVQWSRIGSYLRAHFPHQLVATVPIGAIGYYSGNPVLDLVGLTEPDIARAGRSVPEDALTKRWIGHERNNTEYVLARAPAVIITTEVRAEPWRELADARAGFYADWLLLQEIKAGRAPYHVYDAALSPTEHVLMFVRDGVVDAQP